MGAQDPDGLFGRTARVRPADAAGVHGGRQPTGSEAFLSRIAELAGPDGHSQSVLRRGQRARPAGVVVAGGVVGVVEVDRDLGRPKLKVEAARVGVLDSVEEVAAAAVRFAARGRISEGQEEAATVAPQRKDCEGALVTLKLEAQTTASSIADHPVLAARVDLEGRGVGGRQCRLHSVGRVGPQPHLQSC